MLQQNAKVLGNANSIEIQFEVKNNFMISCYYSGVRKINRRMWCFVRQGVPLSFAAQ